MGIFDVFKKNKKEDLPLAARVNLAEIAKEREKNAQLGDVSILAKADYTKRLPTIRLYYVAFGTFANKTKIGQTYGISSPFRVPTDMSIEDACKVVSYLSDKVETENDLEPACEKSVAMVSNILTNYGFEKVEGKEKGHYHAVTEYCPTRKVESGVFPACEEIKGVVDLFSVGGDLKVFKHSDLHSRYFDWYTEKVSLEEVKEIYRKINQEYLLPDAAAKEKE